MDACGARLFSVAIHFFVGQANLLRSDHSDGGIRVDVWQGDPDGDAHFLEVQIRASRTELFGSSNRLLIDHAWLVSDILGGFRGREQLQDGNRLVGFDPEESRFGLIRFWPPGWLKNSCRRSQAGWLTQVDEPQPPRQTSNRA